MSRRSVPGILRPRGATIVAATLLLGACGGGTGDGTGNGTGNGTGDGTGDRTPEFDRDAAQATAPTAAAASARHGEKALSGLAETGPIAPSPQRPGDPSRGRTALLEAPYVSCGLPLSAWRGARDAGAIEADALDALRLPGRQGESAELPYFNNLVRDANGVEQVAGNCLACHGAPLFGELVIGLGNEFSDWTGDLSAPVERAGAFLNGGDEIAAWERYADRIAAIAPHARMATVGSNPANNITFALIAHRDAETNAWSDAPLLPVPSTSPPPVSVPPWWRMAKKHAMFNLGEGRGDHARIMMAAAMLCTDTRQELEAIDDYAPDIRAFIASIEPPPWPFEIDTTLAVAGEAVFEAHCSVCHGRYGDAPEYPNRLVPIEVVGTDPTLMRQALGAGTPWVEWWSRSYFGELSEARPGPGYVAPPLDGIWATAPYGHNGSVPNLATWLDSASRPARWRHASVDPNDPDSYDTATLGWRHEPVSQAALDALDAAGARRVYDTARPGHGNGGHVFGDGLADEERAAVLEYLKTL